MFQKAINFLGGNPHQREVKLLSAVVDQINALEDEYEALTIEALQGKTAEFRRRVSEGESLDSLLPEAFAVVREASKRTLGLRHYDVQLIGGMTLHKGQIAEMRTGEGKTLVATLPIYLNALTSLGVHLVTVNDYLARRDARWMAPIYQLLGLSVGVLQMAARTENGKKAFLVNLEKKAPHEDQHQLEMVDRVEAYRADITYGTNSEFGFDYLRDNLTLRLNERVQRGHAFAIVDEVDNILIDEARTPLIISGPAQDEAENYVRMSQVVRQLRPEDYEVNEKDRTVSLTELGEAHVEELLDTPLRDPERPEDITPEQARLLGYLEQGLRAQFLYRRNKDYLVQSGKVVIVDEFTGRLMPGRRWSEGLHQAIEAKETVKVEPENITYATITLQNYFRLYGKLAGMTGTALTEAEEFSKIYKLEVLPIPTNLEYQAAKTDAALLEVETKDEEGYKFKYFSRRDDPAQNPIYWRRKDYPDKVYRTEEGKLRAITLEILRFHVIGRPQLVGTTSVEHSERLSDRLQGEALHRLAQTCFLRQAWMQAHNTDFIERVVPELAFLNKPLAELTTNELRVLARSLNVASLNIDDPENIQRLLSPLNLEPEDAPRLLQVLQGGVQHKVLNARKHDEEALIIARAGAFGAVTIATNMAGRGVDIKLGGELPDEILQAVIHVLIRVGIDPYNMKNEEMLIELEKLSQDDIGIYVDSVQAFRQYLSDMEKVRVLGGLHVIGSERHEARRIDNQLRGRAARQGDPGSSRFYLSLEDELMRLFGGGQAEGLMKAFNLDPSVPIESGMLGRLVEQAQERVEGNNFDVRKHLLEYDDVLNSQRKRIYAEREKVFSKENLENDVLEMLQTELQVRIPKRMEDEEGPWKLLAYLEEIQPTMFYEAEQTLVPSFSLTLTLTHLKSIRSKSKADEAFSDILKDLAREALDMERDHLMRSARALIDKTETNLDMAIAERMDTLDAFWDGLGSTAEDLPPRRSQEILDELSGLMHIPLRLDNKSMRLLIEGDDDVKSEIGRQVTESLNTLNIARLVGAFERRLDDMLNLRPAALATQPWSDASNAILDAVETNFDRRTQRLLGDGGAVSQSIETALGRFSQKDLSDDQILEILTRIAQGTRIEIDKKTHRRGWRRITVLNYIFLAAHFLERMDAPDITEQILDHLRNAQAVLRKLFSGFEWDRLSLLQATLDKFDPALQRKLSEILGDQKWVSLKTTPFTEMNSEESAIIRQLLGERVQNQIYKDILLRGISNLWVDYLTRVDALRATIGLEAYAQRNPLVEYKGKASEMFSNLLAEIRQMVISQMFLLQPRKIGAPSSGVEKEGSNRQSVESVPQPVLNESQKKKKRKRH